MRIRRILGQEGKITIPLDIRKECGFKDGDVLRFENISRKAVIISKEKICEGCQPECFKDVHRKDSVEAFLDSLSPEEKKRALLHLWEDKTN